MREFVNADEIARGLSPFQPETVSVEAGRIMLSRIDELIRQGQDFAFETTLSTRSFAGLCDRVKILGYKVCLTFLWLDSEQLAIARVRQRVAEGGHNITEDIIRRRYKKGLINFFELYKNRVDMWLFLDNSQSEPELLAEGGYETHIYNAGKWQLVLNLAK